MKEKEPENNFSPVIILFTCTHNPYGALQILGMNRMAYPSSYVPVKLECAGNLTMGLILRAILNGADGVMVLGCPEEICRHRKGNLIAIETVNAAKGVLTLLGVPEARLCLRLVSASEADALREVLVSYHSELLPLGRNPLRGEEKGDSLVKYQG